MSGQPLDQTAYNSLPGKGSSQNLTPLQTLLQPPTYSSAPGSEPMEAYIRRMMLLEDIETAQSEIKRQKQYGFPRWRPWYDMMPKGHQRA